MKRFLCALALCVLVSGVALADWLPVAEYDDGEGSISIKYENGKYRVHICDKYIVNSVLTECPGSQLGAVKTAILAADKKAHSLQSGAEADGKSLTLGDVSVSVTSQNHETLAG